MPENRSEQIRFKEVQRFRQVWLWAMVLAWPTIMTISLCYALFRQAVLGRPWSHSPLSNGALALTASAPMLVFLALAWLLYVTRMITEVRPDGLYVRFWPLSWRRIPFDQIAECCARTYRPIVEYGGWGIRWGFKGRAYNVSGNQGVQLVLTTGKRLLIGSQRAGELAAAVEGARTPGGS
jgi:hypothetical protein